MNASPLVSVVITTYNRSDALLAVLLGLARQTDPSFEVIVADDGSRTEHQQTILSSGVAQSLRLVHVWHPDVGFTASKVRNRGVAASRGEYIIFLDGDCVPEVDFIAKHKWLAASGFFVNGSRVMLSPRLTADVLKGAERICGRSGWYWLRQRLLGHASKLTGLLRLPDGSMRIQREFSWKGIRSCNFGVWRTDFERVNGFDESFVGWGHEDADFVLRLHNAGVARKNGFCATEVFHLWHQEAARNQESHNAAVVKERASSTITQPTLGYSQQRINDDVRITTLG
ncbi:MAG: glycosyltransferase family 2 protein [Pseudomonadota bacterium]